MSVTVDQLQNVLLSSGLLSADDLTALWNAVPAGERPAEPQAFVQLLVARNVLTSFQAKELAAGRAARLVLGEYVILDEIGAGGMGKVYRAKHRRMQRITALKVMSAAAMKDEASVKRFQREVRAAALLEHPNIVTAYASGEAGSIKYLVMQFVDGGDLSSLVKKSGPLPIEQAVDYALQAARGLAYAHGEGVIHRDIKPANLLLDKKGTIKILDMGLARIETGDDGLTATEQVMGTVDYMSPEQATNTKSADARADVYSLGCTLWFLLTGRKLYEADSMIARLMAHRDAPLPSLVKTRDDASWPLEQALHRMIAKRVDDRFQSMTDVVAALEPFGSGGGSARAAGGGYGSNAANPEYALVTSPSSAATTGAAASSTQAAPPLSSPDTGTDPQSRTLAAQAARREPPSSTRGARLPANKPSSQRLLVGGLAAGAVVIAVIAWLATRGEQPEEPHAAAATTAENRIAPQPASPAVSKPAASHKPVYSIPVAKLEAVDHVWSTPENLGPKVNDHGQNRAPALTEDQLRLIVQYEQAGSDLIEFRRSSVTEPWGSPEYLDGSDYELNPWLSGDGLTLLFGSHGWRSPTNYGARDLFMRRRASRDAPWGRPENLGPVVNTDFDEDQPALSHDGLSLAFQSNRPGGQGGGDLWMARRPSLDAPFQPPFNLGPRVNSPAYEEYPRFLSDDGLLLFVRQAELHMMFRSALGIVAEVSLPMNDHRLQAPWLAPDGVTLYFQRESLPTTRGVADVWVMRRVHRDSPEARAPLKPVEDDPPPEIKAVVFDGHGYQWVPGDMNWYLAASVAEKMGGHLLSLDSAAEEEWVKQTLLAELPVERMVWFGGFKEADNVWRRADGEPMTYQNWKPGEGNDGAVAAAGLSHGVDGIGWGDWGAGNRPIAQGGPLQGRSRCAGLVVEWDVPTPKLRDPNEPEIFDGHRYLIVTRLADWPTAKADAEARGGHLLTINSAAERDWVQRQLWPRAARVEANGRFYFGGVRFSEAEPWRWVTDEPFDSALWLGRGPDDRNPGQLVSTWQYRNGWDDVAPNWRPLPYIVEWDDLK